MSQDFYVSKYEVTVLSEGEPPDTGASLLDLEYLITQGPCAGTVAHVRTTPINAAKMRSLLEEMDADMSVFDLVDEGEEIYDPASVEEEELDLELAGTADYEDEDLD